MNAVVWADEGNGAVPVLAGTSIPVYEIAALLRGQTEAEILEDYPELKSEQVTAAAAYEAMHPNHGLPFPARSFKRALGDAASSGLWDVEDGSEPVAPRPIP